MQYRYTVYDTSRHSYLKRIERPTGSPEQIVTDWTRNPEEAAHFQGVKTAMAVVRLLGAYSEFVIKNAKGEIIG